MARIEVWINKGVGDDNSVKHSIDSNETLGEFKRRFADEMGTTSDNVDVTTPTTKFTNDRATMGSLVKGKETLHILPRAKGG